MSITPKQNEIFSLHLTHICMGTPEGHIQNLVWLCHLAIIEQNMKLPLTIIEYYDVKCDILRMQWCTVTKINVCHGDNVIKQFWDSATLWSKITMKCQITANSFLWILPIVMRLVLIDTLGHAENSDTNVSTVSQTSSLPFWCSLKTYFFKLLLDRWSDFHQNQIKSSSEHADKKLWILWW